MPSEAERLAESDARKKHWKRWGPYLSERAWGTVREDYSRDGSAWEYFPHDHARSRAYRWNEDGLAGICNRQQELCFAIALWNGRDPILKERLYGLTGNEGNHGEDVKELYYYLDSTPTHSYMKFLYKYPQAEFPYLQLIEENRKRSKLDGEFELIDTGIFNDDRYFDVFVEYAKAEVDDIHIRITIANRGPDDASITVLPTVWFRNTWTWDGRSAEGGMRSVGEDGRLETGDRADRVPSTIEIDAPVLGKRWLYLDNPDELLFTENETNNQRLFDSSNQTLYVKDAFHRYVINGETEAVNPEQTGTKAAGLYKLMIPAQTETTIHLRLTDKDLSRKAAKNAKSKNAPNSSGSPPYKGGVDAASADGVVLSADLGPETLDASSGSPPFKGGVAPAAGDGVVVSASNSPDSVFSQLIAEADEFYKNIASPGLSDDARNVQRQAFAGMLWSKQFYHYVIRDWLAGDPAMPKPPDERLRGRNHEWKHLYNSDIISMPDKWEYPWYAAWDLAFHCIPLAMIDPVFAKEQLLLMLREWYMHPNGQIPAYEWAFGDVNPPVHAWAVMRVYQIEKKQKGVGDRKFLARAYQKLLLNFTWWVNRKDAEGKNVFEGGFLGLDNIGVFDRSQPLPTGGTLVQSDGTSWMAMYCLNMGAIALELSFEDDTYEDLASKFWEHFIYISDAMNNLGDRGISLWDEHDGFYYDVLQKQHGDYSLHLKIRSMVGLIPLFAVAVLEQDILDRLPDFKRRMQWFIDNRPDLTGDINTARKPGKGDRRLLALTHRTKLEQVLKIMLDESEFLSPHGIRALSKFHEHCPYVLEVAGHEHRVDYEPAESRSGLFGGNSNWRGPVWFPVNYLLIESLQKFHHYYGDSFKVECPTGSGNMMDLWQVAEEISRRLSHIFLKDSDGKRPVYGGAEKYQTDPNFRDHILFYEYFHGDNAAGLGANHQTGWTGLVAKLLQQSGE